MFFFRERSNWLYEPEDCGDVDRIGADEAPSAAGRLRLHLLSAFTTVLVAVLSVWARLRPIAPQGAASGPRSRRRPALRHGRLLPPATSRRPS